jgi:hypothetical protein
MGRARQNKEDCYDKYNDLSLYYEKQATHAQHMVESWQATEDGLHRARQIWRWSGLLARYEKAILRIPDRAAKNCDWRD